MIDKKIQSKNTEAFLKTLLQQDSENLELNDLLSLEEKVKDPLVISVLVFKLIEERKKTNELLQDINSKYDRLQFELNNKNTKHNTDQENNNFEILSQRDDEILSFIREHKKADAMQIKDLLGYKGKNAASQRLNKLVKDKILKKIQAGRKVYFVVR
jgi:hypothetical protein